MYNGPMLKERIEILRNAGVIDSSVAELTISVINSFEDKDFSTQKMEMFTTHLAMASQRVIKKEELDNLDDFIWQQVQNDQGYEMAKMLLKDVEAQASFEYPVEEKKFLLMHLCNLVKKEDE